MANSLFNDLLLLGTAGPMLAATSKQRKISFAAAGTNLLVYENRSNRPVLITISTDPTLAAPLLSGIASNSGGTDGISFTLVSPGVGGFVQPPVNFIVMPASRLYIQNTSGAAVTGNIMETYIPESAA